MADFRITFDTGAYEELDQLALLARQDYNLGVAGDWFGEWRGGLYGFYARLYGVMTHYWQLHAWTYSPRLPAHIEYHLATLFFNMDSALECLTFAFNAIGFAVHPTAFRDVADERAQRRISPLDVLGNSSRSPPLEPLVGYAQLFPTASLPSRHRRTFVKAGCGKTARPV